MHRAEPNVEDAEAASWVRLQKQLENFELDGCVPQCLSGCGTKYNPLNMIPSKVRVKIWQNIPPSQIPQLRLLSREIRQEIDTVFGTQFVYDEAIPRAIQWAKNVAISKLIVKNIISPIEQEAANELFFLSHPDLLQILEIDGPITSQNFQLILSKCPKIRSISLRMSFFKSRKDTRELLCPYPSRIEGRLMPVSLTSLKSLKIESVLSENRDGFISCTVQPILQQIRSTSTRFTTLHLWIKCDLPNFQYLTNLVHRFILRQQQPTLKHLTLCFPGTRSLIGCGNGDFSPPRVPTREENLLQFPQRLTSLELLDLSRLTGPKSAPWKELLNNQCNLTKLQSCIGTIYWKFYEPIIRKCTSTLTAVSLRQITTLDPHTKTFTPFDLTIFKHCTKLESLELIGVLQVLDYTGVANYAFSPSSEASTKLQNIHKLPTSLQSISLENFKLNPTEVFQLHCTCPALVNLSLQYWNSCRNDVETTLNLLEFMLTQRNYERSSLLDWKEYALNSEVVRARGNETDLRSRTTPRRRDKNMLSSFNDLIDKVRHCMHATVVADNSFAYGIQLVAATTTQAIDGI